MKPYLLAAFCSSLVLTGHCQTIVPPVYTAAVFAPDGQAVILGSHSGIELRSWPNLDLMRRIECGLDTIHDLAFSPNHEWLLVAGGSAARFGEVEIWHWPDERMTKRLRCHDDVVMRVAWSPSGGHWVTASADGHCQVRTSRSHELVSKYQGHSRPVLAVVCLPDEQTIVSAGVDGTVQVWDLQSATRVRSMDNHLASINDLMLLSNGLSEPAASSSAVLPSIVSISDDHTVRLWQPTIGRLVRFARMPDPICALDCRLNGNCLAIATESGEFRVFESQTLNPIFSARVSAARIYAIAMAPEGNAALVVGRGCLEQLRW